MNEVFRTVISEPEFFWLLVGLFFVAVGAFLAHIPTKKTEITNDKYTPAESVTASKRKQRFIN